MNDGQSLLQNPALSEEMLLLLMKHPKHQYLVYKVHTVTLSPRSCKVYKFLFLLLIFSLFTNWLSQSFFSLALQLSTADCIKTSEKELGYPISHSIKFHIHSNHAKSLFVNPSIMTTHFIIQCKYKCVF